MTGRGTRAAWFLGVPAVTLYTVRARVDRPPTSRPGAHPVRVHLTPGMTLNPIKLIRMMRQGDRTAKAYLARRGWQRPKMDWEMIKRLKREVHG